MIVIQMMGYAELAFEGGTLTKVTKLARGLSMGDVVGMGIDTKLNRNVSLLVEIRVSRNFIWSNFTKDQVDKS